MTLPGASNGPRRHLGTWPKSSTIIVLTVIFTKYLESLLFEVKEMV